MGLDSLFSQGTLQVKGAIVDPGIVAKTPLGIGQKLGADVGKGIFRAVGGENRQEHGGERTGPRAHFQHAQRAASGQVRGCRGHRAPNQPLRGLAVASVAIELGEQVRGAAGEEYLDRVFLAGEHVGQAGAGGPNEGDVRGEAGVAFGECGECGQEFDPLGCGDHLPRILVNALQDARFFQCG